MQDVDASPRTPLSIGQPSLGTRAWLCVSLLVLTAMAYANAIFHPFVYDDMVLVLKNPQIRSTEHLAELVGFSSGGFHFNPRWTRDVLYLLQYATVGPTPAVFHATNIALHGLVVLLVFGLVRRISRDVRIAWWSAALFAVHPIHTEVVSQVSGLREVLAALFSLLVVLLLQSYVHHGGAWRIVAAMLALYLGVFSKEMAIMAPIAFVLVDYYEQRAAHPAQHVGTYLRRRAPLLVGFGLYTMALAWAVLFLAMKVGVNGVHGYYDTWAGGLSALSRSRVMATALRLVLLPLGQSVDYSFDALGLSQGGISWAAAGELALLGAAIALTVWGFWRRNWIGFAGAWFALFYLPHAGLVAWHEVFAERFLYLPAIGIYFGLAAVGVSVARTATGRRVAITAGALVLTTLVWGTNQRNEAWSSSRALWTSAVARYPSCARAHKALADAYFKDSEAGPALEHYREAVRILPPYRDAHMGEAVALTALREYDQALAKLDEILERWPDAVIALNTKAFILETMGDTTAALATYQLAVEKEPSFPDAYNNMGRLYVERGELETAVHMYEKALEYNPALVAALDNLAVIYRQGLGDVERAEFYEKRAKELKGMR